MLLPRTVWAKVDVRLADSQPEVRHDPAAYDSLCSFEDLADFLVSLYWIHEGNVVFIVNSLHTAHFRYYSCRHDETVEL